MEYLGIACAPLGALSSAPPSDDATRWFAAAWSARPSEIGRTAPRAYEQPRSCGTAAQSVDVFMERLGQDLRPVPAAKPAVALTGIPSKRIAPRTDVGWKALNRDLDATLELLAEERITMSPSRPS